MIGIDHNGKRSSSLPPLNQYGCYIKKSLQIVDKGCQHNGKLSIDGDIGDFKMSIFRLKDRKKRQNERPSSFNNLYFQKFWNPSQNQIDQQFSQTIRNIIQKPNQIYLNDTIESNSQLNKLKNTKGSVQNLIEDQGYLYYSYLPKEIKQKWFDVVDNSHLIKRNIQHEHYVGKMKKNSLLRKIVHKKQPILRYLAKQCIFHI